ncbi:MAG: class I SAM-dependent methyltransferase [Candidatus Thorarchaeota archaeon]|jgi:ubiquinone/menaquinone biosynthesis C-methylase UbiE
MKLESSFESDVAGCCGDFYNHPIVSKLLDGIFHPGGLALSKLMADRMGIDAESVVLDIACGDGKTATYLAKTLGCRVSGIDASQQMIETAREVATDLRVGNRTDFEVALAGNIPHATGTYSHALSECSLCTFVDKEQATLEITRVLAPGGIFGLNDVTVQDHDELEVELQTLLGRVACIADALSSEDYVNLFQKNGYVLVTSSDHSNLLEDMARKARGRARFFRDVGGAEETMNTMSEAIRIIKMIENQISAGNIGYEMFIFKSE